MNKLISIIVPVYNGEQYISRCVDSILNQTFTDFELILVDDGSKDKSPQICDEYASQDTRVRVIHKANGGVSSARNTGLSSINGGEYVAFIDADDYVVPEYLYRLINEAEDADMVVCGYKYFYQEEEDETVLRAEYPDKIYDAHNMASLLSKNIEDLPFRTPWAKLIKTSIIKEYSLSFDKGMKLGEDTKFVFEYMLHASKIKTISLVGYLYREDHGGNIRRYLMPMKTNINCMTNIMTPYELLKEKYSFECQPFEIEIRRIFTQYSLLYYQKHNLFSFKVYKEYRANVGKIQLYGDGIKFRAITFLESYKQYFLIFLLVIYIFPLIDNMKEIKRFIKTQ